MAYAVSKVDVWMGELEDRSGGLAAKLEPLAAAKANFAFVVARRQPHIPGRGVVFLGPLKGAKQARAAQAAGLSPAVTMAALRVEGPDKAGMVANITRTLADAGINLRGLSAGVAGKKAVVFIAFDSITDADQASKLLRAAGKRK